MENQCLQNRKNFQESVADNFFSDEMLRVSGNSFLIALLQFGNTSLGIPGSVRTRSMKHTWTN